MESIEMRERYLDLLIRVLANTIYEDPPMDPGRPHCFDPEARHTGRDWPRTAHTMVGLARLNNLRDLVQRTLDDDIQGDYIETGVWRGGCCILIAGVLTANGDRQRKVYVADSFAGLPPGKADQYPLDAGAGFDTFEELAIPLDEVKANFARYDLLDPRIVFVKGFFDRTLPTLDAGPFALIRLDGDMYESTIVALEALYPKLSNGGFVIIDDYGAMDACRLAVDDYRHRSGIVAELTPIDWTGAFWRKSTD
jgi:O-methyltransferase/8-demethyl-8-(2,3-dimethoxy-alpha-L-rhamnosyl)tetracenomycin-C 4'-O-methyltransferase